MDTKCPCSLKRYSNPASIKRCEDSCHKQLNTPHLKFLRVVHARDGLHEVGGGVVAEVRADVADPQASVAGLQVLRVLVGWLVQSINLET